MKPPPLPKIPPSTIRRMKMGKVVLAFSFVKGARVAPSIKCLTSAQVRTSWFVGLSPASGSVLPARSTDGAHFGCWVPLSLCPSFARSLSLSLSLKNKHLKKKKKQKIKKKKPLCEKNCTFREGELTYLWLVCWFILCINLERLSCPVARPQISPDVAFQVFFGSD